MADINSDLSVIALNINAIFQSKCIRSQNRDHINMIHLYSLPKRNSVSNDIKRLKVKI